jgi:hypothetical protein
MLDYDLFSDDSDEELPPMECDQFQISEATNGSQGVAERDSRPSNPSQDPSQMSEVAKGKQRAADVEEGLEEDTQQPQSIAQFPNYGDNNRHMPSDNLYIRPMGSQLSNLSNGWTQPPPARPTPAHASLPRQPRTPVELEVVAKLRSQAEKYKPKLPSGLRASRRYSSSPLTNSDGGDNYVSYGPENVIQPENSAPREALQNMFSKVQSEGGTPKFPSDLNQAQWLQERSHTESLDSVPGIQRSLNEMRAERDNQIFYNEFCGEFENFKDELLVTAHTEEELLEQPVSWVGQDYQVSSEQFSGDFEQFKKEREVSEKRLVQDEEEL